MFNLIPANKAAVNRTVRDPFNLFEDDFFLPFPLREGNRFELPVDIREEEDGYELTAELPGVRKEDLRLELENKVLTIGCETREEHKSEKNGYICRERRSGSVCRSFRLEGIDEEGITAAFENGVLTLKLPKDRQDREGVRRIEVA